MNTRLNSRLSNRRCMKKAATSENFTTAIASRMITIVSFARLR